MSSGAILEISTFCYWIITRKIIKIEKKILKITSRANRLSLEISFVKIEVVLLLKKKFNKSERKIIILKIIHPLLHLESKITKKIVVL